MIDWEDVIFFKQRCSWVCSRKKNWSKLLRLKCFILDWVLVKIQLFTKHKAHRLPIFHECNCKSKYIEDKNSKNICKINSPQIGNMGDRRVCVSSVSSQQILKNIASFCNYYEFFWICVKSLLNGINTV